MSDEPQIAPIPTLNYYIEEQSPALRFLVRLVLLAGATNALLTAIFSTAEIIERWPPWSQIVQDAILVLQVMTAVIVAVWCLVVMRTGRGRIVAMITIGIAIVLDACNYLESILQNDPMTAANVVENAGYFLQDCLLPLLIVFILMRADLRPSGQLTQR